MSNILRNSQNFLYHKDACVCVLTKFYLLRDGLLKMHAVRNYINRLHFKHR